MTTDRSAPDLRDKIVCGGFGLDQPTFGLTHLNAES